jgi:hypothetical protein
MQQEGFVAVQIDAAKNQVAGIRPDDLKKSQPLPKSMKPLGDFNTLIALAATVTIDAAATPDSPKRPDYFLHSCAYPWTFADEDACAAF